MPQLGEIRKNDKYQKFIWSACIDCGKERWCLVIRGKARSDRCLSCNAKHTQPNIWKGYNKVTNQISQRAWSVIKRLIKNGTIKQMPCEICGDEKSRAHHPNYDKPLEIAWLCQRHHIKQHKGY